MEPEKNGNLSFAENFYSSESLDTRGSKLQISIWHGTCIQREKKFRSIEVPLLPGFTVLVWNSNCLTHCRPSGLIIPRIQTLSHTIPTCECRGACCTPNVNMCLVCLQFALLENVLTSISDEFTVLRNHKLTFCVATAVFCYVVGLSCVTYVSKISLCCVHLLIWFMLLVSEHCTVRL